jgi:dipeptidyl aminopeptidase/acylaminoacyl peptidase
MRVSFSAAVCAMLIAACAVPVLAAGSAPKPVQAEDLLRLTLLSGAVISPDGAHVAVVASRPNGPKNRYDTTILLVNTETGKTVDATRGTGDDEIAWQPDSSGFAFVRASGDTSTIQHFAMATRYVTPLVQAKWPVSAPVYSHDGRHLLYTMTQVDAPHAAWVDFKRAGFTPTAAQKASDVRTIKQLHFEVNGPGYVYDHHAHLWTADADGMHPHALTSGAYSEGEPAWSPDDRSVVFTSTRKELPSLGPAAVYLVPASGGAFREVPSTLPINDAPAFAPSGDALWFYSSDVKDTAELPAIVSERLDGSARRDIVAHNVVAWGDFGLADLKMPPPEAAPIALPDGRSFIVSVSGHGEVHAVRVDVASGTMHAVTPAHGEASDFTLSHDGTRLAYLYSDFTHPAEVYVTDLAGGMPRQLSHANSAYLARTQLSTPQTFTVTDSAGMPVQAWFMPAIGGAPGAMHPTLFDIHGGPEYEFADTYFDELQYWAGRGYNVVFANVRGSVGYGHDFEEALARDWGNAMFDDVQHVADAVATRPGVDPSRFAVIGGSYGGYAVLWIVSHTDRFKAGIAERVVSDMAPEQLSAYFASDNIDGAYYTWGWPWEKGNINWELSPLKYVTDVHTPLLMLHAQNDIETPRDQTLEEFNALRILGRRDVTLVEFPNENHDLNRVGSPIHRIERLNMFAEWLEPYASP